MNYYCAVCGRPAHQEGDRITICSEFHRVSIHSIEHMADPTAGDQRDPSSENQNKEGSWRDREALL